MVSMSLGPKSTAVRDVVMATTTKNPKPKTTVSAYTVTSSGIGGEGLSFFYLFNDVSQLHFCRPTLDEYESMSFMMLFAPWL